MPDTAPVRQANHRDITERLAHMAEYGRCEGIYGAGLAGVAVREIMRLRAERDELRRLLVSLGAGIPAAAILKAEDRNDG